MAHIPVPNVARVIVTGRLNGQKVANTFYVQGGGGWTAEELQDLADLVNTTWRAEIIPLLHNTYSHIGCIVKDLTTETGITIEAVPGAVANGALAGTPLPNNVSLAIKKVTSLGGRNFRGRMFVAGIPGGHLNGNNAVTDDWSNQFCQALRDFMAAINGSIDVNGILGLVSFVSGGVPRPQGVFQAITDFVCPDKTLDSQRRRLPGRGD